MKSIGIGCISIFRFVGDAMTELVEAVPRLPVIVGLL